MALNDPTKFHDKEFSKTLEEFRIERKGFSETIDKLRQEKYKLESDLVTIKKAVVIINPTQ